MAHTVTMGMPRHEPMPPALRFTATGMSTVVATPNRLERTGINTSATLVLSLARERSPSQTQPTTAYDMYPHNACLNRTAHSSLGLAGLQLSK